MPYLTSAACPEREPRMRWTLPFFLLSSAGRVARPLSYPASGSHCRRGRDKGVGAHLLGEVGCHVLLNKGEWRDSSREDFQKAAARETEQRGGGKKNNHFQQIRRHWE
jgi:hypothetical protein